MDQADSKSSGSDGGGARKPPRRRFQFRILTLLLLITLCAVVAFAWRTFSEISQYREQRRTMALIEALGGSYQTTEASAWVRRIFGNGYQNVLVANLADCDVPVVHLGAIAELPKLRALVVGGSTFTDEHLRQLRHAPALRHVVLDSTQVTDQAIAELRALRPQLEVYTSDRRVMEAIGKAAETWEHEPDSASSELRQLVDGKLLVRCRQIEFLWQMPRDADLAILSSLRHLDGLNLDDGEGERDRSARHVTDAGIGHLRGLTSLRSLGLKGTQITDAGLVHLQGLARLRMLDLSNTSISDDGLAHLTGLSSLEELILVNTRVTNAGVKELERALPRCRVTLAADREGEE